MLRDYRFKRGIIWPTIELVRRTLTRVELYVSQSGSPTSNLGISIRDDPSGSDLASVSVSPGGIPSSPDWVSFDFSDISVTPGSTYYIVMYTTGGSYSQCYKVGFTVGDPYADGSLWYSSTAGSSWTEYTSYDFCFKTYGTGGTPNHPPNKPRIPNGPTTGEVGVEYYYSTNTTDDDGDQLYYLFDWDDGTELEWYGPYKSGETCTLPYIWTAPGTYKIRVKAKDNHNAESIWSDPLAISMPKNKAINTPFLQFLENRPYMFPLLRQILGLQ